MFILLILILFLDICTAANLLFLQSNLIVIYWFHNLVIGFVINGQRIVTNAHVVADQTFVKVRKHGSPQKFKAKVQAVGHECDLALLTVEDEEFWEGMRPLDLGGIPFLQEAVAVVGYPQGYYLVSYFLASF